MRRGSSVSISPVLWGGRRVRMIDAWIVSALRTRSVLTPTSVFRQDFVQWREWRTAPA